MMAAWGLSVPCHRKDWWERAAVSFLPRPPTWFSKPVLSEQKLEASLEGQFSFSGNNCRWPWLQVPL